MVNNLNKYCYTVAPKWHFYAIAIGKMCCYPLPSCYKHSIEFDLQTGLQNTIEYATVFVPLDIKL